ncbi:hypothetical protein BD410DRAFT_900277 [Rickenella mellea]|uniref:Uncharacterized protein n=1 Tax=Rickenella mellea TaxID=50990 RepID=A0A4Y7PXW0_9AGAM|nr:hypothetical protein BD410DRAFT_900277 [Rickenella mellea]
MVRLSAYIRSKPDWWLKYKDPVIRNRWKAEALNSTMVWITEKSLLVPLVQAPALCRNGRVDPELKVTLSEAQVEYVLGELGGYDRLLDEPSGIQVSCFDGFWQSDTLISQNTRDALTEAISPLENVPEHMKDWHPRSNNLVLDIVHPSLYCLVYGRSLGYVSPKQDPYAGLLEAVSAPANVEGSDLMSNRFSWLPTDFKVSETGDVTALAYINNIYPSHKSLYKSVEAVLSCFIPMFERVLTDLSHPLPYRIPGDYFKMSHELDELYPEDEMDWHAIAEWEEVWMKKKTLFLPDVPQDGYTGGRENRKCVVKIRGRTIQVIVKLGNIHLTPQNPAYEGGAWHVEGMRNEDIVATGIYYYDNENITHNELAFRAAVAQPQPSEDRRQVDNYDEYSHKILWGLQYNLNSELNQCVGAVSSITGRCIAFPNTYQHCVSPFRLEDPTKPRHRKILAFFLVDPDRPPIPSTSVVPPQQLAWARDALLESAADPASRMHTLPPEIVTMVLNSIDMMDDKEAKDIRLELMDERTPKPRDHFWDDDDGSDVFTRLFNLCEH